MVEAVASDDPEIEPNIAQPATAAMASPPRRWPIQALAAEKIDAEIPEFVAKCPIRMNSGTTAKS